MPRSTPSPGPNMSTVDRLAMPKERSKGMELTGYTLVERLREMRDIMKVKGKRFAYEPVKVNARLCLHFSFNLYSPAAVDHSVSSYWSFVVRNGAFQLSC